MTALQLDLLAPRFPRAAVPRPVLIEPYEDPFLASIRHQLEEAGSERIPFDENNWDYASRTAVGLDVESFPNFFCICLRRFTDGRRLAFERSDRADFDPAELERAIGGSVVITYNGAAYDLIMVAMALAGASPGHLKRVSDRIVLRGERSFAIQKDLGVRPPPWNHVDLVEVNPAVRQNLKMLNGRLHGRFMVDLPFAPDAVLTLRQMNVATLYCFNDLDATELLYRACREPLELRVALGKIYGVDLRSRSDAQVGEAIVRRRVEQATGRRLARPVGAPTSFRYVPPSWVEFRGDALREVLRRVQEIDFAVVGDDIQSPEYLRGLKISLGRSVYTMGIGGLHSTEAHRAVVADERSFVLDVDVASQYPNMIANLGLCPPATGPEFLPVYRELIRERLGAKARMLEAERALRGDLPEEERAALKREYSAAKVRADGGRIALNGVYGKLGSPYSFLYAPDLVIATTLSCQLAILMLIERAERVGIPVVSANTDGVVFNPLRTHAALLREILAEWAATSGFEVEETPYAALYNSSVNTYMAVREDGKVKRKGAIADPWAAGDLRGQMMKNPNMTVVAAAVEAHITKGVPIEDTVMGCDDPRAFVTLVRVASGGLWRGHPLGRAVRYYWSTYGDSIMYADGSRRVSKTEGAKPLQELGDRVPEDVDYLRYCNEAARLAADLGVRL